MPTITNLLLDLPLPLSDQLVNTLVVNYSLSIDIVINCHYTLINSYTVLTCNIGGDNENDYFYYIDTSKVLSCVKFGLYMQDQFNIYQ